MFPTPAMRRWSSTKAFTGAVRPRGPRRGYSAGNSVLIGSAPRRAAEIFGGELRRHRLSAQPRREIGVTRLGSVQQMPGPEPARIDVGEAMAAVEHEADASMRRGHLGVEK